jgi:uncharacterized membrane protein
LDFLNVTSTAFYGQDYQKFTFEEVTRQLREGKVLLFKNMLFLVSFFVSRKIQKEEGRNMHAKTRQKLHSYWTEQIIRKGGN